MAIGNPIGSTVLINNFDVGNPLHIQANDNSNTTLIPFKLLELESTFDKVNGPVIFNLLQKINNVNKCSCDASKELYLHQQLMKLMQFLMGLDDCYQPVRSALLTRDPLPKLKDAYDTISKEESHRGIPKTSSATELEMSATSFAAKSVINGRRADNNNNNSTRGSNNNNMNRGPNPNLIYKNYGMIGHTIGRHYEIIRYPPGFKKASNPVKQNGFYTQNFIANVDFKNCDKHSSANVSSPGFTSKQMQKLLSLINDITIGSVHANMVGRASFFMKMCYQHLTISTVGMFDVVDITSLKITVGHPNRTLATISHVGNLKLSSKVMLYDILVVPGYCVSILSVNKLIRDSKMYVVFDEDKYYIQELKKEKVLGTSSEFDGLYFFDMD
ncbi:hypothetical protein Tco_1277290 [Tanacetum coccineum]